MFLSLYTVYVCVCVWRMSIPKKDKFSVIEFRYLVCFTCIHWTTSTNMHHILLLFSFHLFHRWLCLHLIVWIVFSFFPSKIKKVFHIQRIVNNNINFLQNCCWWCGDLTYELLFFCVEFTLCLQTEKKTKTNRYGNRIKRNRNEAFTKWMDLE